VADLRKLLSDLLANGRVEGTEIELLRKELYADGIISREEADFLVELHKRIQRRSPGFENFFYQAIKDHILGDGIIDTEEARWLRQMLFRDGKVGEREKKLLHQLKGEAKQTSAEFNALYEECHK
jgi:hypothetical protein